MNRVYTILLLLVCKISFSQDTLQFITVSKDSGVSSYMIQDSSMGYWNTIKLVQPTKLLDSNIYSYSIQKNNKYRILSNMPSFTYTSVTIQIPINQNNICQLDSVSINITKYNDILSFTIVNQIGVDHYLIQKSVNNKRWNNITSIKSNNAYKYTVTIGGNINRHLNNLLYRVIPYFKDKTYSNYYIFK